MIYQSILLLSCLFVLLASCYSEENHFIENYGDDDKDKDNNDPNYLSQVYLRRKEEYIDDFYAYKTDDDDLQDDDPHQESITTDYVEFTTILYDIFGYDIDLSKDSEVNTYLRTNYRIREDENNTHDYDSGDIVELNGIKYLVLKVVRYFVLGEIWD